MGIELASLAVWRYTPTLQDNASLSTAASNFVAAVLIALFINAEHRRSLRSSALPGIYLLVSVLSDLAKVRTYLCYANMGVMIGLSLMTAFNKIILIFILEISKRSHLADSEICELRKNESIMAFWSHSLFLWVDQTMFVGFRTIITVDDLGSLGPEFSSKRLSAALAHNMRNGICSLLATLFRIQITWLIQNKQINNRVVPSSNVALEHLIQNSILPFYQGCALSVSSFHNRYFCITSLPISGGKVAHSLSKSL